MLGSCCARLGDCVSVLARTLAPKLGSVSGWNGEAGPVSGVGPLTTGGADSRRPPPCCGGGPPAVLVPAGRAGAANRGRPSPAHPASRTRATPSAIRRFRILDSFQERALDRRREG